mgnify:CR=1 FL=1
MKKELFRYLSDRRMLLTTILLPGLMIYIVYSITVSYTHLTLPTTERV